MKAKDIITLVSEEQAAKLATREQLKAVLNTKMPKQWLKKHPIVKNCDYLPIGRVEALLDTLFQEWHIEIKSVSQLAQSILCIVRVHYRDPISNEFHFQDGVGAVPLKTEKGKSAAELQYIKNDAVQSGAPAAKSLAIKDAAGHIGKLFGRDLNRVESEEYIGIYRPTFDVEAHENE